MSQSYLKTVMIGLDDLGAAIILNRNDMTISAACGMVRRGAAACEPLRLSSCQTKFLSYTGAALEYFFPGHCEGAIANDILRGSSAISLLTRNQ